MATIKSFTSLEQSKVLAEILPLETADMVIWGKDLDSIAATDAQKFMSGLKDRKMNYLPCWSLAALFDVIPKKINFGYENYSTFVLKPLENGKYLADYYDVSCVKDNPIDACYEVIIRLNELNLL